MRLQLALRVLLPISALASIGCPNESPQGGTGGAGTGAGPSSSSSVGASSSSVGAGGGDAGTVGFVSCWQMPCDVEAGQVCCTSPDVQNCQLMKCPPGLHAVGCDGPEDCQGGACCGTWGQYEVDSSCSPAPCAAPSSALCHSAADCAQGEKCCEVVDAAQYRFCQASPDAAAKCD